MDDQFSLSRQASNVAWFMLVAEPLWRRGYLLWHLVPKFRFGKRSDAGPVCRSKAAKQPGEGGRNQECEGGWLVEFQ
jgi:hypothetical protein